MNPSNVHSFSRSFAREHGVTGAIVLKHIAYKVRTSKNKRDEKLWHYNSAKKLAQKIPYLSASTISAVVRELQENNVLEIGNHNKRRADRTLWFHVTEEVCAEVEMDIIRFDSEVAKKHGILSAVLHFNLRHFLKNQRIQPGKSPSHVMSASKLSELLPFSESAIKKALARLVDAKVIIKCADARATYTFPDEVLKALGKSR